jgi:hypothetical protein
MADIVVTETKVGFDEALPSDRVAVVLAEAVTAGDALYQTSSGTYGIADANAAGKQQFRGIALKTGAAGQVIGMLKKGLCDGFTLAGNPDTSVYLSDTAGKLADAAGTMTVNVGRVFQRTDGVKVLYVDADWLRTWA